MTEKTSVAYRLSDQALDNLEIITRATGTNKTAAVEMALGLLAEKFKGEVAMERTLKSDLVEMADKPITYVGTTYGIWDGPADDPDRTLPASEWLAHIEEMGFDADIPIIDHPTDRWTDQDGFFYQGGDLWFHGSDHATERVFEL